MSTGNGPKGLKGPQYGIVKFGANKPGTGGDALAKLNPEARAAALKKMERLAREGEELKELQDIQSITGVLRVNLAIALDYTASTIGDVATFRRDSSRLMSKLEEAGNVLVLPVAFKGQGINNISYYAERGPVNKLQWFETVANATNLREEPPIVEGLKNALSAGFFVEDRNVVNAIMTIADNGFELDSGYDRAIKEMQQLGVTYVSMVAPNGGSQDIERIIGSHRRAICEPLGHRGKVVVRDQNSDMDPIELTAAIIKNELENRAREIQASEPSQSKSGKVYQPVTLSTFLRQMGEGRQAEQVFEGPLLPGKK